MRHFVVIYILNAALCGNGLSTLDSNTDYSKQNNIITPTKYTPKHQHPSVPQTITSKNV